MKAIIPSYNRLKGVVKYFYKQLRLSKYENHKGRKLALSIIETISLALFKQKNYIETKKSLFEIFNLKRQCSYKTLVVSINRFSRLALLVLITILKVNRKNQHLVKHTDSTEISVCLTRRANSHKTMKFFASWGKTGKGWFYGLKLHITTDLNRKLLSFMITPGNTHDTKPFEKLNKDLNGIFVADAGYISKDLAQRFSKERKRILITQSRKNQKKLIAPFQYHLYNTRMLIELNFRNLKMFYGLVTSLPRSVNGYFANYIYSILAYLIAQNT